jgi:hypothetical protein
MADAIQTKKPKSPYVDWRNRPYAATAGTEEKRKQGERWAALNEYVRRNGGAVTSVPGNKTLRVEVPKGSALPAKLTELGYNVSSHGTVTRVTGAPSISPRDERMFGTPSAFTECDVLEIRLD